MAMPNCGIRTKEQIEKAKQLYDPLRLTHHPNNQKLRASAVKLFEHILRHADDPVYIGAKLVDIGGIAKIKLRTGVYHDDFLRRKQNLEATMVAEAKAYEAGELNPDGSVLYPRSIKEFIPSWWSKAVVTVLNPRRIHLISKFISDHTLVDKDRAEQKLWAIRKKAMFPSPKDTMADIISAVHQVSNEYANLHTRIAISLLDLFPPETSATDAKAWYRIYRAMGKSGMTAAEAIDAVFKNKTSEYYIPASEQSELKQTFELAGVDDTVKKLRAISEQFADTWRSLGADFDEETMTSFFVPQALKKQIASDVYKKKAGESLFHEGWNLAVNADMLGHMEPQYVDKWHFDNPLHDEGQYSSGGKQQPKILAFDTQEEARLWLDARGLKAEIKAPLSYDQMLTAGLHEDLRSQMAKSFSESSQMKARLDTIKRVAEIAIRSAGAGQKDPVFSHTEKEGFVALSEYVPLDPRVFNGPGGKAAEVLYSGFVREDLAEAMRGSWGEHSVPKIFRIGDQWIKSNLTYRSPIRQMRQIPENIILMAFDDARMAAGAAHEFMASGLGRVVSEGGNALRGDFEPPHRQSALYKAIFQNDMSGLSPDEAKLIRHFKAYGFVENGVMNAVGAAGDAPWQVGLYDIASIGMDGAATLKAKALGGAHGAGKAMRALSKADLIAREMYHMSDMWSKWYAFKWHVMENKMSLDGAAQRVRDTQFSFSDLPPIIRKYSSLAPFFLTTNFNMARIFKNHLTKYGNVHAAGTMMKMAALAAAPAMISAAIRGEEDEEVLEAEKDYMGRRGPGVFDVVLHSKDDPTDVLSINMSPLIPFGNFIEEANRDRKSHDRKGIFGWTKAGLKNFTPLSVQYVMAAMSGRDSFGRPIVNDIPTVGGYKQDRDGVISRKYVDYFARGFVPTYPYVADQIAWAMTPKEERPSYWTVAAPVAPSREMNLTEEADWNMAEFERMEKGYDTAEEQRNPYLSDVQMEENDEAYEDYYDPYAEEEE